MIWRSFKLIVLFFFLASCMVQKTSNRANREVDSSGNLFVNSNILLQNACACQNSTAISNKSECTTFCSSKDHEDQRLYVDVLLNPKVYANSQTPNLFDWCKKERVLDNGTIEGANPNCYIQVEDSEGISSSLDVVVESGRESLNFNIDGLEYGENYRISLIQTPSLDASDEIQFIKAHPLETAGLGRLAITPINYYECERFELDAQTQNVFYSYRLTYYFSNKLPSIMPAGYPFAICHEGAVGTDDSIDKPRLALDSAQFSSWSLSDPRFYDNDNDSKLDIHNILEIETGIELPVIFEPYTHATDPLNADATLGFFMNAWIDPDTLQSFCLDNTHYESDNVLFQELGLLIGVETEGFYRANRASPFEYVLNPESNIIENINKTTFVDLSETQLKRMWFTVDQTGAEVPLTDETVAGKDIFFWWPYDPTKLNIPPSERDNQELFQVITPTSSGAAPSFDKRAGCIPKK